MRKIFGVTGSLGCGKSTVSHLLKKHSKGALFDADLAVHRILSHHRPTIRRIRKIFGPDVMDKTNRRIDRKKLGRRVFADGQSLKTLTRLLHPRVKKDFAKYAMKHKGTLILDAPLLLEAGMDHSVNFVIVVKSSLTQRLSRAKKRLGYSPAQAMKIIRFQWPQKKKEKYADFIVNNNGSIKQTENQVKNLLKKVSA